MKYAVYIVVAVIVSFFAYHSFHTGAQASTKVQNAVSAHKAMLDNL